MWVVIEKMSEATERKRKNWNPHYNPKPRKRATEEEFKNRNEAEQWIVNCIRGASDKKEALKYYRKLVAIRIYKNP